MKKYAQTITERHREYSVWSRFWSSKVNTAPVGILVLLLNYFHQKWEGTVLDWLFSGNWIWAVLIGYLVGLIQSDWFDENSWIKFTWNKWYVGVRHNLDLSRSEDQTYSPVGYERWFFTHEIENIKRKRCIDSFNTRVNIKTGLTRVASFATQSGIELSHANREALITRYTFSKKTTCVDLLHVEPVKLIEFFLPKDPNGKMTYRVLSPEYDEKFSAGPAEIIGDFDLSVTCKSECFGAETHEILTLSRKGEELILLGDSGSFKCAACYGGKR